MFHLTKKRAVIIAVVGSLALGAGAYAYFTSTGTGSGQATVGSSTAWAVEAQATQGVMTPDGPVATINYTVKNNSTGYQNLANVAISVANGTTPWSAAGTPPCTKGDFRIGGPTAPDPAFELVGVTYNDATVVNVAPNATVTRTAKIQMVDNGLNQDACQGKTPLLHLVAS
jgi:hypothetical protein